MMRSTAFLFLLLTGLFPPAPPVASPAETAAPPANTEAVSEEICPETEGASSDPDEAGRIVLTFGEYSYPVTLEDSETAKAFAALLAENPVIVDAHDYSGFEKVGSLDASLPRNDVRSVTAPGDFVLYNGDQLVLFYGSNTWSYTRLGHLDDPAGLQEALGDSDVTLTFSLAEDPS